MLPTEDPNAPIHLDNLKNLVGELRMMARRLLSTESKAHSFTPTALAMTALRRAKLTAQDWEIVHWENRPHFFSALSRAMRHALIDHARRRLAKGREHVVYFPPDEPFFRDLPAEAEERPAAFLMLDEALEQLQAGDQQLGDILHQHYFLGYSAPEIAQLTEVSEKTVDRNLKRARVALRKIIDQQNKC